MRLFKNSDINKKIPWSRIHLSMIRFVFCSFLAFFALLSGPAQAAPVAETASSPPAPPQNTVLVQQGIDAFENKNFEDALQSLESAAIIYPENYVIPYYLGMIYLQQKDRREAVTQWKKYVALKPDDESALKIRKYITLLLRKEARDYAQKAVAGKADGRIGPVDESTVVVTTFKNLGSKKLNPLGKGMAAMIIADLSVFKSLNIVEREKLQALLMELKLGTSGLVDEKSAPKVGKLLQAKFVASGSLTDLEKETLQIASILFDAGNNFPSGFQDVKGEVSKFYDLEKKIACRIAADLGKDCKNAPKAFEKIHTKSLPALIAYSQGLNLLDKEKFDDARSKFEAALQEDPQFDLAIEALAATPSDAMLRLTEAQMAANAAANVPATTAAIIPTPADVAPPASASPGDTAPKGIFGTRIGTKAALTGGGVLLGGGIIAAVAMSGGDSGGGDSGSSGTSETLLGIWRGESGEITLNIDEQNGNTVSGTIEIENTDCIGDGPLTVSGQQDDSNQVQLEISNVARLTAVVEYSDGGGRLRGRIDFNSGQCSDTSLEFTAIKTGSARVGF